MSAHHRSDRAPGDVGRFKCDSCDRPAVAIVGETTGVLACEEHARPAPEPTPSEGGLRECRTCGHSEPHDSQRGFCRRSDCDCDAPDYRRALNRHPTAAAHPAPEPQHDAAVAARAEGEELPSAPCRNCGPGYRIGDEGCRHDPYEPRSGETGVCRTCALPIWWEEGEVGHRKAVGWSDRIERGGDSLVCFKAVGYRHVPMGSREEAIYDAGVKAGRAAERGER